MKTIRKGKSGAICVQATEFKGKKYIDVRNFYDQGGELKPTPKGIMIPLEDAELVINAIKAELSAKPKSSSSKADKKETLYALALSPTSKKISEVKIFDSFVDAKASSVGKNTCILKFTNGYQLDGDKYNFADFGEVVACAKNNKWVRP